MINNLIRSALIVSLDWMQLQSNSDDAKVFNDSFTDAYD